MQIVIDVPEEDYKLVCKYNEDFTSYPMTRRLYEAVKIGTPLPKEHGRLIDADKCLDVAWQKFYKQEDKHEKHIEGYDILRDRFYKQEGFECCQQVIVNAPTIIEADKEKRMKQLLESAERMHKNLLFAFVDPDFVAGQKEKKETLDNCPLVEWVPDMGNNIPFCRETRDFCNYCRKR